MSAYKIFNVADLAIDKLPSALFLTEALQSYYFSVLWTRDGSAITLSSVLISPSGANDWQQVLNSKITDNDGEITVAMGLLKQGSIIDLLFNVFPHQNISACALQLTNHNTDQVKKIAPASGNQALTKRKPWSNLVTIKLQ